MKRRAVCLIRPQPHYRREAFKEGLQKMGFEVTFNKDVPRKEGDVLLLWNRYGQHDGLAKKWEERKNPVIIVENGYLDFRTSKKAFALSLCHHNGGGHYPCLSASRACLLAVEIQPWKDKGKNILLLPQRGIGPPRVAMPRTWSDRVYERMKKKGPPCEVVTRKHPGTNKNAKPLEEDLRKARCAATWGSGAALKALVAGVPVFYDFKDWIGKEGACYDSINALLDDPVSKMGDREAMLENVANAQWSVEEVREGTPFDHLLELHRKLVKKGIL